MARRIYLDPTRCNGCGDCVSECRRVHALNAWSSLVRVVRTSQSDSSPWDGPRWEWRSCRQCDSPDCIPACPTKAIRKAGDGIVQIDAAHCDGCGDCLPACSDRAICLDMARRKALKCDLCLDRVEQGRVPACIARCEAQALFFGTEEQWETFRKERAARRATGKM